MTKYGDLPTSLMKFCSVSSTKSYSDIYEGFAISSAQQNGAMTIRMIPIREIIMNMVPLMLIVLQLFHHGVSNTPRYLLDCPIYCMHSTI